MTTLLEKIYEYHSKPDDEVKALLEKLHTRQLLKMKGYASSRITCSCGPKYHCGDDVLSDRERAYNQRQREVKALILEVLATRPHIPGKAEGKALRRAAAKKGR